MSCGTVAYDPSAPIAGAPPQRSFSEAGEENQSEAGEENETG